MKPFSSRPGFLQLALEAFAAPDGVVEPESLEFLLALLEGLAGAGA